MTEFSTSLLQKHNCIDGTMSQIMAQWMFLYYLFSEYKQCYKNKINSINLLLTTLYSNLIKLLFQQSHRSYNINSRTFFNGICKKKVNKYLETADTNMLIKHCTQYRVDTLMCYWIGDQTKQPTKSRSSHKWNKIKDAF